MVTTWRWGRKERGKYKRLVKCLLCTGTALGNNGATVSKPAVVPALSECSVLEDTTKQVICDAIVPQKERLVCGYN